jgi:hypothetical protein
MFILSNYKGVGNFFFFLSSPHHDVAVHKFVFINFFPGRTKHGKLET